MSAATTSLSYSIFSNFFPFILYFFGCIKNLDPAPRNKEYLKAIRREEVSFEEVQSKFKEKERYLTKLYETSDLVPMLPRKSEIKDLLFQAIEMHYGDISSIVPKDDVYRKAFDDMKNLVDKYRGML